MFKVIVTILAIIAVCLALESSSSSNCQPNSNDCDSFSNKYSQEANIKLTVEEMLKKGHGKPFGSHKPADFLVSELPYMISPEDFYMNFVIHLKPVKFEGAANGWPALHLWTDKYFNENYGNETIKMDTEGQKTDKSLGEFLKQYKDDHSKLQLNSKIFLGMKKEIAVPTCLRCKEMREMITARFMLSNGNEISSIHIDTDDKLLCSFDGKKKVLLVSPVNSELLYADEALVQGISDIDAAAVDLERYPNVMNITYWQTDISKGDCVYVPRMWWHQISSSKGRQLAVELQWKLKTLWNSIDNAEKRTSIKLTPEQKKENMPYSFSSALKKFEHWTHEIAPKMPLLQCKEQKVLMSQYRWETDKEENAPMTLGDQGVLEEEISEEIDDLDAINKRLNEKVQDGEVVCFFDSKNKKSPCKMKGCDELESLHCISYILHYCGIYDDRGCVINKPHLLNKKLFDEMDEMRQMRKQF